MKYSVILVSLIGSAQSATPVAAWSGGPAYDMHYHKSSGKLMWDVTVPSGMWFAMVFGDNMSGNDAVAFVGANSGGNNGNTEDLWLSGNYAPSKDTTNNYSPTAAVTFASNVYTFKTQRALDTGDSKDFKVECGKTYNWKWVGNSSSSSTSAKHNKSGSYTFATNSDCSAKNVSGASALAISTITAASLIAAQYL